jgi:hypothetical protein
MSPAAFAAAILEQSPAIAVAASPVRFSLARDLFSR